MTLAACCGLIEALEQTFDTKAYWTTLTVAFVISPGAGATLKQGSLRMMGNLHWSYLSCHLTCCLVASHGMSPAVWLPHTGCHQLACWLTVSLAVSASASRSACGALYAASKTTSHTQSKGEGV